jgi:hypothetical protein
VIFLLLLGCAVDGDKAHGVEDPTWSADVAPIVGKSCVGCHHAGGVGSTDFTAYATAAPMAAAMASYVAADIMPPPAMDPTCREYAGHERMVLTAAERETLANWADDGAPEGDPIAELTWDAPALDRVDAELVLPTAHAVTPGADGNEYYCQVLDNPFTQTTYVTGFDVLVDQPSVVHHAILSIDTSADAGEWTGESDLSDGWNCKGRITEDDWSMLHAWAPGMEPTAFSDGLGLRIEPGDQIVLQMHYFADDADAGTLDQSGYRLRTADSVTTEVYMAPVGPSGFSLPAGDVTTPEDRYLNEYGIDVTVYGVFPHMHLLASAYSAVIESPAGGECLAKADAWDFGHQATYLYDQPAVWSDGETLVTSCTYDNTSGNPNQYNDPPQAVTYGEGTTQEMCFFLFYFSY